MPACEGATPRAQRLLARVRAATGTDAGGLAFMISGGCCGGTNPVLCARTTIIDGFDVQLGEVEGIGVWAHPDHARYLESDRFVIDAIDGARSDTFSLEIAHGGRFVLRELPSAS
jgi:uncharacterized protein (DUF779 family)